MAKVQARELFRAAKRKGLELGFDQGYHNCALGMVLAMHNLTYDDYIRDDPPMGPSQYASELTGLSHKDMMALEGGHDTCREWLRNNRYYRVGQNLRKMVLAHRKRNK